MSRVLFLFLDGVGIGPADPEVNPFLRARLPVLTTALGGRLPTLSDPSPAGSVARAFPVDACLGVSGLPQSGTGQFSLLAGENGAERFRRHFGPWVPVRLRTLLDGQNLLVRAVEAGKTVAFANAYPSGYPGGRRSRRIAGVVAAAMSAGALTRDHEHLAKGDAVASEIVNDGWIDRLGRTELPRVSADVAGRNLAAIAATADLTMFAHYHTDTAGHARDMDLGVAALERVDRFLGGLLESKDLASTIVVFSDHGNIEDVRGGHTRNPSLGMVLGGGSGGPEDPTNLVEVRDFVLRLLVDDASHAAM